MLSRWREMIYEFGAATVAEAERYRLRVGNLLAALGTVISLGYGLFYLLALGSVAAFAANLVFAVSYLAYFAIVRAGHPKRARIAICAVFLVQIMVLVLVFLTRRSGLQLYFIIAGPIAFILFEARDRALRLGLAVVSMLCYIAAETTPAPGLLGDLPSALYRMVGLSTVLVVVFLLLLIQNTFQQEIDWREAALEEAARTDSLTGLPNRRALLEWCDAQVSRAVRHAQPLAVLMIDLDHFKEVNDRHGHAVGDRVLVAVASAVRKAARREDVLARFGGEEFVALLPQTDGAAAMAVAEKLREQTATVAVPLALLDGGEAIRCTASVGVASLRAGETSIEPALARADQALYRAKAGGRNRCVAFDA